MKTNKKQLRNVSIIDKYDLQNLAANFIIDENEIQNKENLLNNFKNRFPIEKLSELSLKDYIEVGSVDTIAYYLEYKKEKLDNSVMTHGVGGGSAMKFGIYQDRTTKLYKSGKSNKSLITYENYEDANEYFKNNILNVLIDTIVNFNINKVNTYDSNNSTIGASILLRLLFIYYPESFLTITQFETLEKIAHTLGIDNSLIENKKLILLNYIISQEIKSNNIFKNWHFEKLGKFFWDNFRESNELFMDLAEQNKTNNLFINNINYWIFQANPDIYNLFAALKKGYVKSWRVVNFKNQIKIDDLVIIWQTGKNAGCYALAKVVSEVQIMDDLNLDLEDYTNEEDSKKDIERVKLEILNNFADNPIKKEEIKDLKEFTNFKAGNQGTNFSATKEEYERIKLLRDLDKYPSSINSDEEISEANPQRLNQILYGPPGTGKTYNTINKALEIIDPVVYALNKKNRNVLKKEFKKYVDEGRIVFTSFHQSLSYEDFIEGIKPDTNQDGSIKYEVKDGIFKKIINNINLKKINNNNVFNNLIKDDTNYLKVSLGNSLNDNDSLIYDYCINKNCIAIGWGEDINFTTTKSEEEVKEKILKSGIETKERDYNLIAIKCLKFWTKVGDIVFVSNGNKKIRAIGKIDGDYFYDENTEIRFKQFRPVQWLIKDADIDVNLVYNKNFSQQTIYMLFNNEIKKSFFNSFDTKENEKNVTDNFVLIIDEINRGNVSQIFGELITLIEEDKRLGKDEELTVKLPYSQDDFGVPPNLYIIGTMNTADRSVEALDTALRRRFSFVEMMPDPEKIREGWTGDPIIKGINLTDKDIDLIDLLITINTRIEMLLDRDHLIGHSYFMGIKDEASLANTFKDKIIPLLQEYFYGDYGKIGLVLGSGFVEKMQKSDKSIFSDFSTGYESVEDLTDKPVYRLKNIDETNIIAALTLLGIKDA